MSFLVVPPYFSFNSFPYTYNYALHEKKKKPRRFCLLRHLLCYVTDFIPTHDYYKPGSRTPLDSPLLLITHTVIAI